MKISKHTHEKDRVLLHISFLIQNKQTLLCYSIIGKEHEKARGSA
jgi:hypothetical protein